MQNTSKPAQWRDPTPVLVIGTVVMAGFVTALVLYVLGGLISRFLPGERCSVDNPCEDGDRCQQGKCVPGPREVVCRSGDQLDSGCYCPWRQEEGVCTRTPLSSPSCDGELSALLQELQEALRQCKSSGKGEDATSCRPEDLSDFMLRHGQFHHLLNKAPMTAWVMFPPGRPKLDGSWPKAPIYNKYLGNLRYDADVLAEASHILVLSHATLDNSKNNVAYLQERLKLVFKMIQDLRKSDTPARRDEWWRAVRGKFMAFPIPSEQRVTLADFSSVSPAVSIVTGNDHDQLRYSKVLAALQGRDKAQPDKQDYLDFEEELNRSVTIVPLFCK